MTILSKQSAAPRDKKSRWSTARRATAGIAATAIPAGAVVSFRARHEAPFRPRLERVDVELCDSIFRRRPVRIGFVADTHIGPVVSAQDVDRALALLRSGNPDLLLLGGDYVCESPRYIPQAAAVFRDYAAAAPCGAIAVLGNHDYANGASRLVASFERQGIPVLRNESMRISSPAGDFWIAGIDDAMLGSPDPPRAFADIPVGAPVVTLWHEPDWAGEIAPLGSLLQLSGHTHGGQIRLPMVGNIAAPSGGRRYVAGLNVVAGMPLYTTRGVGVFRPPIRFRCRPEVSLLTLA